MRLEVKCNTVLIVDDDEDIRDVVKMSLELEGYDTITANHGLDGLERLKHMAEQPCLVLLDLMMPVMDGWEFVRNIERDHVLSDIPIAVVSAFSEKAATLKGKVFLKKPIDLESLLQLVKRYCHAEKSE